MVGMRLCSGAGSAGSGPVPALTESLAMSPQAASTAATPISAARPRPAMRDIKFAPITNRTTSTSNTTPKPPLGP